MIRISPWKSRSLPIVYVPTTIKPSGSACKNSSDVRTAKFMTSCWEGNAYEGSQYL